MVSITADTENKEKKPKMIHGTLVTVTDVNVEVVAKVLACMIRYNPSSPLKLIVNTTDSQN
jgi:hypothetical protein